MARNTNPVMDVIRENFDGGDPWGSAIEAHFQICYTLTRYGAPVPADWEFRMGAFEPEEDDNDPENEDGDGSYLGWELDLLMRQGHMSNLIDAGNVLKRYLHILEMAGYSY